MKNIKQINSDVINYLICSKIRKVKEYPFENETLLFLSEFVDLINNIEYDCNDVNSKLTYYKKLNDFIDENCTKANVIGSQLEIIVRQLENKADTEKSINDFRNSMGYIYNVIVWKCDEINRLYNEYNKAIN